MMPNNEMTTIEPANCSLWCASPGRSDRSRAGKSAQHTLPALYARRYQFTASSRGCCPLIERRPEEPAKWLYDELVMADNEARRRVGAAVE
jgi:hypothetical protein